MLRSRARLSAFAFCLGTLLSLLNVARAAADLDCSDFAYQQDAQTYFESRGGSRFNDVDRLDRDHDGVACELLPRRTTLDHSATDVPHTATQSFANSPPQDE